MGSISAKLSAKADAKPASKQIRTSLKLPELLDRNLEFYCAMEGMSKNAAVVSLIEAQLKDKGYRTDVLPSLVYAESI